MRLRLGRRPQAPSEAAEEEPYHISYGGNNEAERDHRILGWVGGVVGDAAAGDQADALESEEPIEGAESDENDDDDDDNEDEDEDEDEAQEGDDAEEVGSVIYTDCQVGVDDDRRPLADDTHSRGARGNARARTAARIRAQLDLQALQLSPRHRGGAHAFIALLHDSHSIPLLHLDKTAADPHQSSSKYQPARLGGYGYGDRDPKRRAPAFLDDYYPREQKAVTKHFDRDDPKNQGIDFEYESSPSYDDSADLAPVRLCRQVPVSRATSSEPAAISSHPYDTAFCRPVSKRKHSAAASESDSQSHHDRDWFPNLGYERHSLDYGSEPREDRDYFPHQMCLLDYDGKVQPKEEPRSDADAFAEGSGAGGDNDEAGSASGGSRAASEDNVGGDQSGGDDSEGDGTQDGQSEHGGSASSSNGDSSESDNGDGSEGESGNGNGSDGESNEDESDDGDDDDGNINAPPVTPGRYIATNQVLTPRGGFPNVPFAGPQTRQNTAPNKMRDQPLSPGQGYVSVPVAETQGVQILYGYEQAERDGGQVGDGESQAGKSGDGESGEGESGEGESEDGQSVKEESDEGESDDGESDEDENVKAESDDGNSNDASRDDGQVD